MALAFALAVSPISLIAQEPPAEEEKPAEAPQPERGVLWRWVDDAGVVHYSDKPVAGAERVRVRSPQTYSVQEALPARPTARDRNAPAAEVDTGTGYRSLRITAPENDSVAWNVGGEIQVSVAPEPALRPGDRIVVFFNGEAVDGTPMASTSIGLTGIYRGTHTVYATIVDADGAQVIQSEPVTFHVRQTSIKNPQRRP